MYNFNSKLPKKCPYEILERLIKNLPEDLKKNKEAQQSIQEARYIQSDIWLALNDKTIFTTALFILRFIQTLIEDSHPFLADISKEIDLIFGKNNLKEINSSLIEELKEINKNLIKNIEALIKTGMIILEYLKNQVSPFAAFLVIKSFQLYMFNKSFIYLMLDKIILTILRETIRIERKETIENEKNEGIEGIEGIDRPFNCNEL